MQPIRKTTIIKDDNFGEIALSSLEVGEYLSPILILFLHGWGGSAESWKLLWSEFFKRCGGPSIRLVALDLPGFGKSSSPARSWNVNDYSICVVKYLQQQKYRNLYLISHSFGGRIVTKISAQYANLLKISGLVYLAPAGIKHNSFIYWLVRPLKKILNLSSFNKTSSYKNLRIFFYKLIGSRDYLNAQGTMRETLKKVIEEDLTPLLSKIQIRALIIWGERDSYVPVRDGYKMAKLFSHSEFFVIKKAKHAIHQTQTGIIAKKVCQFLIPS